MDDEAAAGRNELEPADRRWEGETGIVWLRMKVGCAGAGEDDADCAVLAAAGANEAECVVAGELEAETGADT
jgi:hypothetical protein